MQDNETTWALVPIKDFASAKSRLAATLTGEQCATLAACMAADVIATLRACAGIHRVICLGTEPGIRIFAAEHDCEFIAERPGAGLSASLDHAARQLQQDGAHSLLIVPSDLPTITPADVDALLDSHRGGLTICPAARDGGTNAMVISPPTGIGFLFGEKSCARHIRAAEVAGLEHRVVNAAAFGHDIDQPADLARLSRIAAHGHTAEYLRQPEMKSTLLSEARTDRRSEPSGPESATTALNKHRQTAGGPATTSYDNRPLEELLTAAAAQRDAGKGDIVTYSRKVFIPLTELCRDVCHYCTYAKTPSRLDQAYLQPEDVLRIAAAGKAAGCREALFTLGDKPELRYRAARDALKSLGCTTTLEYVKKMAQLVLDETGLLPHLNPGVLQREDYAQLREVSPSMGIMLESASERLAQRGGPHFGSPDKHPQVRLDAIAAAGDARVALTTGILIGIGETRQERIDSLVALHELHQRYGHIQEIIVQNFVPKPDTKMHAVAAPAFDELLWTIAVARLVFGPDMNIQVPPNLNANRLPALIAAGINDWGGVSPVTPDHVNPESPWPHLGTLAEQTAQAGKRLTQRLTIYPEYATQAERWIDPALRANVLRQHDSEGYAREDTWVVGAAMKPPFRVKRTVTPTPNSRLDTILARAQDGIALTSAQIETLFAARGDDFAAVCHAADAVRAELCGDDVTYVVNRNINYTNLCLYKCKFCAFSKGKTSENLRGAPYVLDTDEISRRSAEAWSRGATEVCLQGGIHPAYTGNTYLEICRAVKDATPDMHIHAFSPLEVTHGAQTLGKSIEAFLRDLRSAGLASLPGTAAEILDDDIRDIICPDKLCTDAWLEVIATAHKIGLRTTSTIMFGHLEAPRHWATHLLRLRALQERTGGITEFVPLPFVHMEAPLYHRGQARVGPTYRETMLMHAVARLALNPVIGNIQTSWVKLGAEGAADCLNAGVNDLGGTLMNESISRAAGASHGQELAPLRMDTLIESLGRTPRQRTTLYGTPPEERVTTSYDARPLTEIHNAPAKSYQAAS